jgi:hypothetical protein
MKMFKLKMHTQRCYFSKKETEPRSLKEGKRELKSSWEEWQTPCLSKWIKNLKKRQTK